MSSEIKKIIYFIRHGEDVEGVQKLFQGHTSELTSAGKAQARLVAQRLKNTTAEVILSSPMTRARQTAATISAHTRLPVEEHDMLREYLAPSALLGLSRSSPEALVYIDAMMEHLHEPDWHYADEDNVWDLHHRAVSILDHLSQRKEREIIVVSHGGIIRTAIAAMMTEGKPDPILVRYLLRFLKPTNTGLMVCHYIPRAERRNKWRLVTWNDYAHLKTQLADEYISGE